MDSTPFVLVEVEDGIGWMVLNEPARLNPVYPERIVEINAAAGQPSARDDVRVGVVTGAAPRFGSGALRTMKGMLVAGLDETKREHLVEQYFRFSERDPEFDNSAYRQRFRDKATR